MNHRRLATLALLIAVLYSSVAVARSTDFTGRTIGVPGSGTVTSVTCGTGLNGGTFTTSGTCSIAGDTVATGISAAGTNQGTATLLTAIQSYVGTVASGTGVRLGTAAVGAHRYVANEGANTLLLYPASGGGINSQSANVPVSIPPDTTALLIGKSSTVWRTVP